MNTRNAKSFIFYVIVALIVYTFIGILRLNMSTTTTTIIIDSKIIVSNYIDNSDNDLIFKVVRPDKEVESNYLNTLDMNTYIYEKDLTNVDKNPLYALHIKVYNTMTDQELIVFYQREKITEELFKNKLNVNQDRELLSKLFPGPNEMNDRVTDQLRLKLNVTKTKNILYWSPRERIPPNILKTNNCNVQQCILTHDLSSLRKADAILFKDEIPWETKDTFSIKDHQLLIVSKLESSLSSPVISKGAKANWSATYRKDSVLNTPYGRFKPYLNVSNLPLEADRNYAENKTALVAWIASNCGGHNNRYHYVKSLQKHIDIDVYGKCGNKQCQKDECFHLLKKKYKFYLAFENSNCKDYVTEKLFFNALQNDVVPVVMGAHPDEYKRIAPPRSYIHVDMFKSQKQLAEYLKFLNENDELYNSYFLWKNTGEFIDSKFVCRLCAMVHLAPHFPMWYNDVNAWWGPDTSCLKSSHANIYLSWSKERVNASQQSR